MAVLIKSFDWWTHIFLYIINEYDNMQFWLRCCEPKETFRHSVRHLMLFTKFRCVDYRMFNVLLVFYNKNVFYLVKYIILLFFVLLHMCPKDLLCKKFRQQYSEIFYFEFQWMHLLKYPIYIASSFHFFLMCSTQVS